MRRLGIFALSLVCLAAGAGFAQAQDKYPSKPIKIIVPYVPGGATDIVARILADQMGKSLGQSVIVENKPGAFGIIAIEDMVKAGADGYTLMIGNVSTNAISPIIYPQKFKIDYAKDVVPITNVVDIPAFLVATTKDFDAKSVPELIAYAKKNPGQVRYGTVGPGSYPHYDMAYFAKRAGDLDMIAIPNKAGATGVINDMLNRLDPSHLPQRGEQRAAGEGRQPARARPGQSCAAAGLSRRGDDAGAWLPRRRHHRLAGPVRAGRHAAAGAAGDFRRHGRGHEGARGGRSVQEADLQPRAQHIARRRQGLARGADGRLAQDHQRSEDRDRVRALP